jgi:hypothetical protein
LLTGLNFKNSLLQEFTTSTSKDSKTEVVERTDKTVAASLKAVAQMVFPFRALETPKHWMQCCTQKPTELPIHTTVAAGGRPYNTPPLFPDGKESDTFTPGEMLEILEWSIPKVWRTKFDSGGYVLTEFTMERFMTECEAIEQNGPKTSIESNNLTHNGKP